MISIRTNVDRVARELAANAKQIPFATAVALTTTAKAAQAQLRAKLGADFVIRNRFVAGGIRIRPATKTRLQAEVGSRDRFMALQASGGQRARPGARALAIPVAARANPRALTRKSKWPGKIAGRKGAFFLPLKGRDGTRGGNGVGLFTRRGRGKNSRLVLWYVMRRTVQIKPRWHFEREVQRAVSARLPTATTAAIARALQPKKR